MRRTPAGRGQHQPSPFDPAPTVQRTASPQTDPHQSNWSVSTTAGVIPPTARGRATRAALIQSARQVFERDGFLEARITDITATANVATGSFYSYFASKEKIFSAVIDEMIRDEGLQSPGLAFLADARENLVSEMARYHRDYLLRYARNAKLMSVMEQVTNVSQEFRGHRTANAQSVMQSSAEAIRRLQAAGIVDPNLNPMQTARSLSVMVSRSAYVAFVLERETVEQIDVLVSTLGRLWLNALRIEVDPAELALLG